MSGKSLDMEWVAARRRSSRDFWWFCRHILGDDFFNGNAEAIDTQFHRDLCRFISAKRSDSKPISVVIAPRGFLKSMIANEAHDIYLLGMNPSERILLCHGIDETATMMVKNIRIQMETNERLQWLLSDVLWKNPNKEAWTWNDSALTVRRPWEDNVPSIIASGLEGTKAGLHYTRIKDDDLTNDQNCNNADQVTKTTKTFERHMNLLRQNGRLDFICTIWSYYDTSWYLTAKENPLSKLTVTFQRSCWVDPNAPDDKLESQWPKVKSTQFLLNQRLTRPVQFATQMLCKRVLDGATVFDEKDVKRYELEWEEWAGKLRPVLPDAQPLRRGETGREQRNYRIYMAVDLNIKQHEKADYGVVTVGAKDDKGHTWILKIRRGRPTTTEMIQWIREWCQWFEPDGLILETSAFQHSMVDLLHKDSIESGVNYPIIEENRGNHQSKPVRIKLYQNAVKIGLLHVPMGSDYDYLMEELRAYTSSESDRDDVLDTVVDIHNRGAVPESITQPRTRLTQLLAQPQDVVADFLDGTFGGGSLSFGNGALERSF